MSGSFVMISFGSERSVSTVFVQSLTGSQYLEGDQELRGYTLVFDAQVESQLQPGPMADLCCGGSDLMTPHSLGAGAAAPRGG